MFISHFFPYVTFHMDRQKEILIVKVGKGIQIGLEIWTKARL